MDKAPVRPLTHAYRLLNPGPVTLVSVAEGERDNLFAVTWTMPVRKDPPMVAILSGKRHFSYPILEQTGEFGISVPDRALADAVYGCGTTTGREELDKFARFCLTRQPSSRIRAPLVAECVAGLECRVSQVVDLGASALLLAQVLEATASTEHFRDGHWRFDQGLELLHHLSGQRFCTSAVAVEAARPRQEPRRNA
jgi:flavin reductase (DIM6/NTAB) family NADH-FMN oxidoreductase RutF